MDNFEKEETFRIDIEGVYGVSGGIDVAIGLH